MGDLERSARRTPGIGVLIIRAVCGDNYWRSVLDTLLEVWKEVLKLVAVIAG